VSAVNIFYALDMDAPVTVRANDAPSACRLDCTVPRCGDGILDGGETCDDGNNVDGDGCNADCH
jgi:cysteine-rich repeat protein